MLCSSPTARRGQDLRFLREMDFATCPMPDPGSMSGSTTTTFSSKTRWWFAKNKPAASSKSTYQKSAETVKTFPLSSSKNKLSTTSVSSKYELSDDEVALPKLDQEEYWANYGSEDASVRCFELECPPGYDGDAFDSASFLSTRSLASLLCVSVVTLSLPLLFG